MKPTFFLALTAQLLLGASAFEQLTFDLYSDTNCQTHVPGTGQTSTDFGTCNTGPFETGWSSAKINGPPGNYADTITFYTKNDCGCPTCGSHGYSANDTGCLTGFGFTANAIGYQNLQV